MPDYTKPVAATMSEKDVAILMKRYLEKCSQSDFHKTRAHDFGKANWLRLNQECRDLYRWVFPVEAAHINCARANAAMPNGIDYEGLILSRQEKHLPY